MDRELLEAQLAKTERHIAQCKIFIERRRAQITELERSGQDARLPRELLDALTQALALHLGERDRLRRELREG